VERAAAALRNAGVQGALINAGGSVKALGRRPDGNPWRVGIQHPREADGVLAIIPMADGEVVITSGDYQRYFQADGRRYHHIIDPDTGYPAEAMIGVSLIGQDAFIADTLSTAIFVKGLEEGRELLQRDDAFEYVAYTPEAELEVSPGLRERAEIRP
jgi:FAD:protein FMN transferase